MSFEAAWSDVSAALDAALTAWAGPPSPLAVAVDNRWLVDQRTQADPYLCVELHFIDAEQASFGQTKDVIDYGQIHLIVHTREGQGTLAGRKILDHFRPYFQLRDFSILRTHVAKGAPAYDKDGWNCQMLVVPFRFHSLVT